MKNEDSQGKMKINLRKIKQVWTDYREERKLAKQGKTKKSRLSERDRYRKVEHRLNLAIIAVSLALVIVLLFTFFI